MHVEPLACKWRLPHGWCNVAHRIEDHNSHLEQRLRRYHDGILKPFTTEESMRWAWSQFWFAPMTQSFKLSHLWHGFINVLSYRSTARSFLSLEKLAEGHQAFPPCMSVVAATHSWNRPWPAWWTPNVYRPSAFGIHGCSQIARTTWKLWWSSEDQVLPGIWILAIYGHTIHIRVCIQSDPTKWPGLPVKICKDDIRWPSVALDPISQSARHSAKQRLQRASAQFHPWLGLGQEAVEFKAQRWSILQASFMSHLDDALHCCESSKSATKQSLRSRQCCKSPGAPRRSEWQSWRRTKSRFYSHSIVSKCVLI